MDGTFFERLRESSRARDSLLCVGLDPEPDRIAGGVEEAVAHCRRVVEATSDVACAYKPNSAFWEQYGPDGWRGLQALRAAIPPDVPVIIDAKRADVPSTMRAYARALFDVLDADAVTAHAYHGVESLQVFTERPDRAVYVVCRTSNPGAADLQELDAGGEPLFVAVGRVAQRAGGSGNVGLVTGATAPTEITALRQEFPAMPFLIPGVGAQGGDLQASVDAAWNGDPASCLVTASRSILYADDPATAARDMVERMRAVVAARR